MENKDTILIRKMLTLVESANKKVSTLNENIEATEETQVDEQGVVDAAKAGAETIGNIFKNERGLFNNTLKQELPFLQRYKSVDELIQGLESGALSTQESFSLIKQVGKSSPEIAAKLRGLISDSPTIKQVAQKVYPKGLQGPANQQNLKLAQETLMKTYNMSAQEAEAVLKNAIQKGAGDVKAASAFKGVKGGDPAMRAKALGTTPEVAKFVAQDTKPVEEIGKLKEVSKAEPAAASAFEKAGVAIGKYSASVLDKLKKIKGKLNAKQLALYGLAGFGIYELLKGSFNGNDEVLPDCVGQLPDANVTTSKTGDVVITSKTPIDDVSKADIAAGANLAFYPKRVFTIGKNGVMNRGSYSCSGGKVVAEQTAPTANAYNNNIKVTWDSKDKTPKPNPGQSRYHDCSKKDVNKENLEFGCKSDQIKEIQVCLGMEAKYQTGNFGPLTKKAIADAGYDASQGITATIYNTVKQKCSGKTADDTTDNVRAPRLNPEIIKSPRPSLPGLGDLNTALLSKINTSINQDIQPSNTGLTDRQKQILNGVIDRGFDVVYKGGTLTPEEQTWLSGYYGGQVDKVKNNKDYGQKVRIQPNQQNDQNG
jgi:hypothetical protein